MDTFVLLAFDFFFQFKPISFCWNKQNKFLLKVFLQYEAEICKKNTGQRFSIKSKATCKNSAHLDDI